MHTCVCCVTAGQVHKRRNDLDDPDDSSSKQKYRNHKKKLLSTTRTIRMTYASTMVGLAECLPIGVLQVNPSAPYGLAFCRFLHLSAHGPLCMRLAITSNW